MKTRRVACEKARETRAPKKMARLLHVATLYAARSTGSRIILCNRVVPQLTLLHHSLRLYRPAGLESSEQAVPRIQNENAPEGASEVCPVKDENTLCGV